MIRKFILAGVLLLFAVSVTGLNHSEQSIETRMDVTPDLKSEIKSSIEVREKTNQARCALRFHGEGTDHGWSGNVQASLSCPGDSEVSEGITARLATPDSSAPDEVLVVPNSELCNEDRVCYRMTSGTVDVNVVNNPPTVRGNPLYEDDGQTGENPLYERSLDSTAIIGFGSFSISKRSARTGRNPQTGKEIQSSGDESDRALANRMLASIKASNCPEDGRERCVVEAVKNSEVYSDLAAEGEVEILMTLTADPLVVPRSEGSGDCNDSDIDRRPGEVLCGQTTHFIDPDSDGDGLDDLTMEQSGNLFEWKVNGEIVAKATVHSARAAETQLFFLQVDSSEAEVASRPELVEAIADHSGLSKADSKKALDSFVDATLAVELDKSSPYIYQRSSDIDESTTGHGSGVPWPYNLTRQAPTQFILEYGPAPTYRAGWPPGPNWMPINASVPKGAVISESGDCNDTSEDGRPALCGQTTHFLSPDLDGDGLEDLVVVETAEGLIWKIDSEVMVTAGISSVAQTNMNEETTGVGSQTVFLNIEEASSRPELVEAIASKSGLSRAESEKALDTFIYISMKVAYDELDKSTPYLARYGDKATPEIQDALVRKDARIAELEARINELESRESMNSTRETTEGNDPVVRKKPGRAQGIDTDSDADGLSDGTEEQEVVDPVRRPGFVNRLVSSIFG